MSSTSNSQNLLVNVFRPTYVYSSGTGYTPKLVLSNIDILTANQIVTDNFQFGGLSGNVYIGSNVGGATSSSNNVAVGVNAMSTGTNTRGTVAIGYSALQVANNSCNSVVIGTETTGGGVSNVILGARSGTTGSNVILLGSGLTTTGDVSGKLYVGAGSLSNTVLYADFTTKRVGINTQDPLAELDVSGDAHISKWLAVGFDNARAAVDVNGYVYSTLGFAAQGGSATAPAFTFIDDSGTGFYQRGNGFAITTNGQERVIVNDASFGINGDLWVTGTVNISGIATNNLVIPGYIRIPSSSAPTMDLSDGNANFAGTVDVATALRAGVGSYIRIGSIAAPTTDISGSSIRTSNVFATGFVQTPFVHDAGGSFDLSSGNLRVSSNIVFSNVLRTPGGAIRVGTLGAPTVDISGSNVRADGTVQGATINAGTGAVNAPSHSFSADPSLGLYRVGANQLGFASAGVQRMVISNGNVGIGRANPVVALDVSGDISANVYNGPGGTASAPHYTFSDDRTTGVFFPGANIVGFTAGGTERMRISNAAIGIGTTAPTNALDVSGTMRVIGTAGQITFSNGTINAEVGINISGTSIVSPNGSFSNLATTSNSIGGVTLSNSNAIVGGFLRNALNPTQFDISSGNISNSNTTRSSNFITGTASSNSIGGVTLNASNIIGGTGSNSIGGVTLSNSNAIVGGFLRNALTPSQFDISSGNISNSGILTTGNVRTVDGSSAIPAYSFSSETNLGFYRIGASHIGFASAGCNRMVISNTNVGIGVDTPQYPLHVVSASNFHAQFAHPTGQATIMVAGNGTAGTCNAVQLYHGPSAWGLYTSNTLPFTIFTSNTQWFTLLSNGSVGIGTTVPQATLDVSAVGSTIRITDLRTTGIPSLEFVRGTTQTFGGDANTDWRIRNVGGDLTFTRAESTAGANLNGQLVAMTYDGRLDVSGVGMTVAGYLRNSLTPSQFDISGGNISNSLTTRSSNFITGTASSNSIGGVTLNASNITAGTGSNQIGGVTFNASNITAGTGSNSIGGVILNTSNIIGGTGSNSIGGVMLSNGLVRSGAGTQAIPAYTFSNATTSGLYAVGSNEVRLSLSNSDRLRLLAQSSVGASDVSRTTLAMFGYGVNSASVGSDQVINEILFRNSLEQYTSAIRQVQSNGALIDGNRLGFFTSPGSTGGDGLVERLTVTRGGRVGIANTNPSHALDVSGTIRGSSNVVAVYTTSNAGGSYTGGTETDITTFTYTPKQSGTPLIVIQAYFEAYYPGGAGSETATVKLTDNANTELALWYVSIDGNNSLGRSSRGCGSIVYHTTVSGATTFKLRYSETGDDTLNVARIYIVVNEISTV